MKAMLRLPTLAGAMLLSGALGGCATRPAAPEKTVPTPVALILATPRYELHLRDGRVYELVPPTTPDGLPTLKPIEQLGDFRTLYEATTGRALPAAAADGSVEVNGWANLACVREGHACGAQPEGAPHAPIRLYFRF